MSWLDDAKAVFVLVAYGVAAAGLLGLLFLSLYASRKKKTVWERLEQTRGRRG